MNALVVGVFLLALVPVALAGPVTTLARGRCLLRPTSTDQPTLATASTQVTAAVAVGSLAAGLGAMLVLYIVESLAHSDGPDGIPQPVWTRILWSVWLPVTAVVGATLATRAARRSRVLFVLGLLAPVVQLALGIAVGDVVGS